MNQDNATRLWSFAVAGVTLLGFALRLTGIDGPPLKLWDDFITLDIADQPDALAVIQQLLGQQQPYVDFQPPLFPLIIHWVLAFSRTDYAVRLPSVIAGTLAIPAVYFFVRSLFSRGAGFFASIVLAMSLFQIEYSQQVRPYALFLVLSVLSMWLFYLFATTPWRNQQWGRTAFWYVLVSLGMCFTSYLGFLNLLCQGVWFGVLLVCSRRGEPARFAWWRVLVVLTITGVVSLPWLFFSASARSVVSGGSNPRILELFGLLWEACREFFSYYNVYLSFRGAAIPFLAICLLGVAASATKKRVALSYLLFWLILPMAILVLRDSGDHHVRIRYLIGAYVSLVVLAGVGLERATLMLKATKGWKVCAIGLAIFAVVNLVNWPTYSYFYRRDTDGLKELAMLLERMDVQPDSLFVVAGNSMWSASLTTKALDWYLPGRFEPLAQLNPSRYRRIAVLVPENTVLNPVISGDVYPLGKFRGMKIMGTGLVNHSPLPLLVGVNGVAVYSAHPASLQVFGDASSSSNVKLEPNGLAVESKDRPGFISFRFVRPNRGALDRATLSITGVFTPSINGKKESSMAVLVRKGQGQFREIGRFESRDALLASDGTGGHLNLALELPTDVRESADFEIRLVIDNSKDYGRLTLEKFSLDAAANPGDALADRSWLAGQVEELTKRLGASPWKEGTYPVCRGIRVGGPGRSETGRPVYVAKDGQGNPITEYFDGRLDHPDIPLVPGRGIELGCGARRTDNVLGVRLSASRLGTLRFGELPIALNMTAPTGATVTVDASGGVRLSHSPLFEQPLSPSAREIPEGELLTKAGEPCLSCRGAEPCALEYTYESGLPMTGLRLMFYPRVFANWRFSNRVQVHYSVDDGPFQQLYSFRGSASGTWEGLNVPRTVHKAFAIPGKKLKLRYILSGDGAQLWSSQDYPMRLSIDCTPMSPPVFPAICPIKVAIDTPVDAFAALCRIPVLRESLWRPF